MPKKEDSKPDSGQLIAFGKKSQKVESSEWDEQSFLLQAARLTHLEQSFQHVQKNMIEISELGIKVSQVACLNHPRKGFKIIRTEAVSDLPSPVDQVLPLKKRDS